MTGLRLGLLLAALAASIASINPENDIPFADDCDRTAFAIVDGISLVHPDDDSVVQDLEVHELVFGSQGGTMVRIRVRAQGANIPSCMPMTITYEKCLDAECSQVDPESIIPSMISLRTYEEGAERMTKVHFSEIGYYLQQGDLARVTFEVGPEEDPEVASALMWLGYEGNFEERLSDAGPSDAGLSDAGLSDAGPSDAGPSDAGSADAF